MYDHYVLWLRTLLFGNDYNLPVTREDRAFAGFITLCVTVALCVFMFIALALALAVLA